MDDTFFFLIDKQSNILEKAKKAACIQGVYWTAPKEAGKTTKKGKSFTHPQVVPSHSKKPNSE